MNAVFDVLRHSSLNEYFETALIHYLSINLDLEAFKGISWIGNGGVYSGEVIIQKLNAEKWQKIYAIVLKCNNQLNLIPIKAYIKKYIEYELRDAEIERKIKFIRPEY